VCPKTSSNSEKKKIVEEAGGKRMKLRAKLRKGSTGCWALFGPLNDAKL
jgi:hypothetical protein